MKPQLLTALALGLALTACRPVPDDSDTGDTTDTTDTVDTVDTTDTTDTDTSTPGVNCHVLPSSLPDFFGGIPTTPGVTTTEYTNDAGLDDVLAAVEAAATLPATVNIAVSNVTVTQVGFKAATSTQRFVWFADANGALRTFFPSGATGPIPDDAVVSPGDVVSFTVTSVGKYGDEPQIVNLTDWTIESAGGSAAYYVDATGETISIPDDISYVHHIYGELVSDPTDCGGPVCFDYQHGGSTGPTIILRIRNENLGANALVRGDCIEVFAPMTAFDGEAQVDLQNFAWFRWYNNSSN